MNKIVIMLATSLGLLSSAHADTYSWTNDRGVVSFSDDPNVIPPQYRAKAKRGEDITIRNPLIQQEINEQENRAAQEKLNTPDLAPTPDSTPSARPLPALEATKPVSGEPPAGRTKSQRIKDNIERRETGEKK